MSDAKANPAAAGSKPPWELVGLKAVEYRRVCTDLGREPNPTELQLYGVLWSEHCSYKHSRNSLKKLPTTGARVLQGPGEGAGVIDLGDGWALAFKIESHNHPSFIEPFQGAATGVGGILRDVFSMGARPIAILDSLRFGPLTDAKQRHLFAGAGDYTDRHFCGSHALGHHRPYPKMVAQSTLRKR